MCLRCLILQYTQLHPNGPAFQSRAIDIGDVIIEIDGECVCVCVRARVHACVRVCVAASVAPAPSSDDLLSQV